MQDKQRFFNNKSKVGAGTSSEASLITLERSQKLDLLIHLITNLRPSLVICGPSGIGKSTMLDELKSRKKDGWFVIDIQATANLSLESFQHQLFRFLILNYSEYDGQELSTTLDTLAKENKKVVVIMDDSSLLVPNLISTFIQYAATNECLRIIFSLTHDDLEIKKTTDQLIDECHYIDIPPLTEKQCGIFLRNQSVRRDVAVSFSEVNESLVRRIYHETHGVPGGIISELPTLSRKTKQTDYKWMGAIVFIAAMVTGGIGYLIFDEDDSKKNMSKVVEGKISYQVALNERKLKSSPQVISPVNKVNSVQKVKLEEEIETLDLKSKEQKKDMPIIFSKESSIGSERKSENLFEDFGKNKLDLSKNDVEIKLPKENKKIPIVASSSKIDKRIENTKAKVEAQHLDNDNKPLEKVEIINVVNRKVKKSEPITRPISDLKNKKENPVIEFDKEKKIEKKIQSNAKKDDRAWILKQPKDFYTMQLMVLSSRDSAVKFLKKNKKLKDKLKFFKLSGKSKYVVIYGSFKDAQKLYKEMEPLPEVFKKAWVRKFSKIQKQLNNN